MSKLKIRYFGIGVIFCGLTIFLLFNFVGPGKNDLQSAREMIEKEGFTIVKADEYTALQEKITKLETEKQQVSKHEENKEVKDEKQTLTFEIRQGMSLQEIADGLEGVHIIHNRNEFIRYMTDNQLQHAIQIGKFEFKNNMSYEEIAEIITK